MHQQYIEPAGAGTGGGGQAPARRDGLLRRLAQASCGGLLLLASLGLAPSTAIAADGVDIDALIEKIKGEKVSTPEEVQKAVLTRLGDAEQIFDKCIAFFHGNAKNRQVDAILRGIDQKPGQMVAVSLETFQALKKASGNHGDVTQAELDLCVRTLDVQIGGAEIYARTLEQIDRSVYKCLKVAKVGPPNGAATRVISGLTRRPGSRVFTENDTLASLKRAYGYDVNLTRLDLESCAAVYDVNVGKPQAPRTVVGDPSSGCDPDQTFCPSLGSAQPICCDNSTSYCSFVCDEDDCDPVCESKCFPSEATVQMEDGGTKAMRDVQIGDRVQVVRADGSIGFEDVYLLTHKDATTTSSYVRLALDNGRALVLSPRHFIPVTTSGSASWDDRVTVGADEVHAGDRVWYLAEDGEMRIAAVAAATREASVGAFNPLTMDGTIIVDGVIASAHSDWFLDGYVSADAQAGIYQAMFMPVRGIYRLIGPDMTRTIAEDLGVVDAARGGTASLPMTLGWAGGLLVLVGLVVAVPVVRRRRALAH